MMSGKDKLKYGNGKEKRLCRIHLIEEFRKEYLKFKEKMVVIYPDLETRKKSYYAYQYYTKEEIKKYNLADMVGGLTEQGLNAISGTCQRCSDTGSVAFFGKESFRWDNDWPMLEEINQEPQILCKNCTLELIIPSLRDFQGHFKEPVTLPRKDEGILLPITY
jgi:hypothetical protein